MNLNIGTCDDGKPFTLPADLGDKKIALLAQSKKGKTYGLGCILEELAEAQRPFIANDPGNNLYGLRVLPDGSPSGLKVVIIGGTHADIPFEKDAGERLAEALLATPICAVIDVAFESLGSVRRFWTDFAGRLMRSKPEIPRLIVLEESQVLIPQSAYGPQTQICKSAVAKIATIGGNFGYGVIAASQRAATIDKDVLSQCEALIVMGMTHTADRKTVREWMEAKDVDERTEAAFKELGSLKAGQAWYWAPNDDRFEKFTFRKRRTLHPREMQKLGLKDSAVHLGDMQAFVERVKKDLTKTTVSVHVHDPQPATKQALRRLVEKVTSGPVHVMQVPNDRTVRAEAEVQRLEAELVRVKEELGREQFLRVEAVERLESVRKVMLPQYEALENLFSELGKGEAKPTVDRGLFEPMLLKAGQRGCRRMLELMIERRQLTKTQLGTLAGVPAGKSTFRSYMAWLKANGLVDVDGDVVRLKEVS